MVSAFDGCVVAHQREKKCCINRRENWEQGKEMNEKILKI